MFFITSCDQLIVESSSHNGFGSSRFNVPGSTSDSEL
jgi:hypothetical protein